MDEHCTLLAAVAAAIALSATAALAQTTIYKQVDEEGRVIFTDQPSPSARIVSSYQSSARPAPRLTDAEVIERVEGVPFDAESGQVAERAPAAGAGQPPALGGPRARNSDIERAVFGYAPLNSPTAARIDASEASRRARQEANKAASAPVLVAKPVASERVKVDLREGVNVYYAIWALTFLMLAGGLLYVGWQVFRLILGEAFPRWHIGMG